MLFIFLQLSEEHETGRLTPGDKTYEIIICFETVRVLLLSNKALLGGSPNPIAVSNAIR